MHTGTVSITLNAANVKYHQFYLSSVREFFFPSGKHDDTIFELEVGAPEPIFTKITTEYLCFNKKSWMKAFFQAHNLKIGDQILITRTGSGSFRVEASKVRNL